MSRLILTLHEEDAGKALQGGEFDEVFLWDHSARSTFIGPTDAYLSNLGSVNPRNVDLVRIALGVLAADRSILRKGKGSNWNSRDFHLTIPVEDPSIWSFHSNRLAQLIGFLSGDRWTFTFAPAPPLSTPILPIQGQQHHRTILLSGGADSAAGALLSIVNLGTRSSQALVSQYSSTNLSPGQKKIVTALRDLRPEVRQEHYQFRLHRGSKRLDGSLFRNEASTRSRSLLFLALGLAVAERAGSALWIPENGFASLNPPLGPDRRGSLSTHTTHPKFLRDLSKLVQDVGGYSAIENPFEELTKGEMFTRVAQAIGEDAASTYLSATNSCSHTDARYSGAPSGSSCGVCFGCLVRRASFMASGVADQTSYLVNDPTGRFDPFIKQKSIIEPMRDFVYRGVQAHDVMAMTLPQDYSARRALELSQKGVEELRSLVG